MPYPGTSTLNVEIYTRARTLARTFVKIILQIVDSQ